MYEDDYIIDVIEKFKNKKTNEPLSKETIKNYIIYFFQLSEGEEENIINYLIINQNDRNKINKKFRWIKSQGWLKNPQKDLNKARSLNYLIFLNQLLNKLIDIKDKLKEDIFKKLKRDIKQMKKMNVEMNDNKTSFGTLAIEWKDYLEKVKELTKKPDVPLRDKILYNLYKTLPLRDDFGDVELVEKDYDDDSIKNFYNINTHMFHLRNYKTKHTFGNKKYKMFKYLADLIKKSFDDGNRFLIVKNSGEKFYNGKLSKYIIYNSSNYFGKSISIDDIRHSVITYFNENKTLLQRRKLASLMLHSLSTATEIYNREKR